MTTRRRSWLAVTLAGLVTASVVATATGPTASGAAPTDLFFSEYVEGSSLNKALEIYNGTGSAVDLAAGGYNIFVSFNGGTATSTFDLAGAVADGDVFVFADDGADPTILAVTDQTTTASLFNGDDAILLRKGTTVLDAIGQLGVDPGSEWGSGLTSTADNTLRRMASVCAGDTDATDAFDPASEWDGFANNTFDGLGAHTSTCDGTARTPVINEFVANHTGTDTSEYVEVYGAPSTDLSALTILQIEGDAGTSAGTIDSVLPVGTTDADGFWVSPFLNNEIENGTMTLLLVSDFTGSAGSDLDTGNDGTFDVTPWSAIVDSVAVSDGGSTDVTYGGPVLAAQYDGLPFTPGGASRIPDGLDTGMPSDWVRNDFDLAGLPGVPGTPMVGEALNTPGATNVAYEPPPGGVCGDPAVSIHDIQGDGLEFDPAFGGTQSVEGVVTLVASGLSGFYLQTQAPDGDPATSEGIFVFLGSTPATVTAGDVVRVTGIVSEYTTSGGSSQTEMSSPIVTSCGTTAPLPAPEALTFPVDAVTDMEPFEGMLTQLPQDLVISEYFNYDRFGEVVVSLPLPGDDRLYTPTAVVDPGAPAQVLAAEYPLRRITIDDLRSSQNPDPAIHPGNGMEFTLDNRFRGGDTITGITGVIDESFGLYRLQPSAYGTYTVRNPRPEAPDDVGGDTRVASMNVLNYFTTLDNGSPICGPDPDEGQDCRGADNAAELTRQRDKILAAITGLDADVVGLIELENTTGVDPVDDLLNGPGGLNDTLGAGTYDAIDTGTIGTDAIRVALIYRPAAVTPVGDYAVLDSSVDPRFIDTKNRPALAQSFESASGRTFTVAVNHLKSKGSDCNDLDPPDPDLGDGQGNCNATRTAAAEALADWLATDPTGSGNNDSLVIGDLNSYDKEDPITALLDAGYTDLIAAFGGEKAYSYVFDGQNGYLDHGLASPGLVDAVTGATEWHINADEPDILDYDTSFKQAAQDALYEPNAYRSSDHDPVVIGLDLTPPTIDVSVTPDVLWPPNHQYVEVQATVTVSDAVDPNPTVRLVSVTSNEPDNGEDDGDTVDDIVIVDDDTFLLRAERSGTGNGRIYTITYEVSDAAGNVAVGTATVTVPISR